MPEGAKAVHEYFTVFDWGVVVGYLGLTTLVGHLMRGKQATIHDFFLGGKSLPWQAVSGSMWLGDCAREVPGRAERAQGVLRELVLPVGVTRDGLHLTRDEVGHRFDHIAVRHVAHGAAW